MTIGSGPNNTPSLNGKVGSAGKNIVQSENNNKTKLGCTVRTWLIRIKFMKGSNCEASIGKIRSRLPRVLRRIVAHPIHQIKEFAAPKSGIEDIIIFALRQPVHLDGQRDLHNASTTRPGNVFATCGSRRLTWNTGWMCIDGGNSRRKEEEPC